MQINKYLILLAALALLIVTLVATLRDGFFTGMAIPFQAGFWTWQYFIDLVIALGLVLVWLWRDARSRGKSPYPWVIATLFFGSFSPLAYLFFRSQDQNIP